VDLELRHIEAEVYTAALSWGVLGRLLLLLAWPAVALADRPVVFAIGGDAGVSLQSDQYVAGGRFGVRVARFPYAQVDLALLAGLGPDHVNLRSSLRLRPRFEVEGVHGSLIGGLSLFSYFARGPFAQFCDKADLDCDHTAFGFELGLGLGYRWAGIDFVFATGDLPLYTITGGVTFTL
jgi:hypothetical protein